MLFVEWYKVEGDKDPKKDMEVKEFQRCKDEILVVKVRKDQSVKWHLNWAVKNFLILWKMCVNVSDRYHSVRRWVHVNTAQRQWNGAETVSDCCHQHMAAGLPPKYSHCGLQTTSACLLSSHTNLGNLESNSVILHV